MASMVLQALLLCPVSSLKKLQARAVVVNLSNYASMIFFAMGGSTSLHY